MDLQASDVMIFCALLGLSALCSGSESALTAVNPVRIRALAETGSRTARRVERLIADRSRVISTLLVGNNIVNTALTVFATLVFTGALPKSIDPALQATIASVVTVVFLLVFGEVLPKTFGVNMPVRVALLVAWPVTLMEFILAPATALMTGFQKLALRLVGHEPEPVVTGDDLRAMVALADEGKMLGKGSGDAIVNLLDLHETRVREVMTPRTDVVALSVNASWDDVTNVFRTNRFSRIPIYTGDIDDIVGVLNFRDLIGMLPTDFSIEQLMRKPVYVPEQKRIDALILEMRRTKNHMAIVVDEYGGTAGLITLEDLLEEVVGQIEDEFDDEAAGIRMLREGMAVVDAGCSLDDIERALKADIVDGEEADNIASLFLREYGKIPVEGDRITLKNVEIVVNRMHGKRIRRFLVSTEAARNGANPDDEKR
ncbi:MAG: hemolysin family protein [Planctomycetes bacterium]|nr:hemolysin family protein [Planctomycetota bacterium]NUQ33722.1 HlyC/CorC family transporter [Planctomycetaceae bacterium]